MVLLTRDNRKLLTSVTLLSSCAIFFSFLFTSNKFLLYAGLLSKDQEKKYQIGNLPILGSVIFLGLLLLFIIFILLESFSLSLSSFNSEEFES